MYLFDLSLYKVNLTLQINILAMYSYTMFLLVTFSLLVCVSCTEDVRYIDDILSNISSTEEKNPVSFKLTTSLDINMNGKSQISESNLNSLLGTDRVKIIEVSGSPKTEGKTNDMEQFRKDVVNALRAMNAEISKIKENTYNIENYIEKENTGVKTTVGVQYKPSSVKKGKTNLSKIYPKSCKEIFDSGNNVSGIYEIKPKISSTPIVVLCDMETRGGGWTHIQKRFDGSQDFYLEWRDYKFGFGDLDGEFWIGLENIYKMTVQDGTELLVEVEDRDGARAYAHYTSFKIGAEKEGYPLSILSGFSGDAGDPLSHHLGSKFSTKDFDQDSNAGNCAVLFSGAWWYKDCHLSNLNGKYINLDLPAAYKFQGLHWSGYRPHEYSYAKSRMLLRSV